MKNNKGFTLIEIISVIIILSVLLLIAVPVVSKTITNAKKDAFIQNAKDEIEIAKGKLLNGDFAVEKHYNSTEKPTKCKTPPIGYYTSISNNEIGGNNKSAFGFEFIESYVLAVNVSDNGKGTGTKDKIIYYYGAIDKSKNGITYTQQDKLNKSKIKIGTSPEHNFIIKNNPRYTIMYNGITMPYNFYQTCKKR